MKNYLSTLKNHLPVIVYSLFTMMYILVVLGIHQWDPMSFVRVGGYFDPRVGGEEMGYDGQFGYQIAIDPSDAWQYLDIPVYRYQRILFPILVKILALGQSEFVPWMMIAVNFICGVVSIYLLARLLHRFNQSGWYALAYSLFIGTLMSLRLDLNEILAYTLVIAGITAWMEEKSAWGTVFFASAILTKEITVLFLLGFTLATAFQNPRKGFILATLGIIPYLVVKLGLFLRFQDWGLNSGGAMATSFEWIPYAGWWKLAFINFKNFALVSVLIFPLAILPSLTGLFLSVKQFFFRQFDAFTLSLFLTSLLIPFLPSSNLLDPLGISRAVMALVLSLLLFAAKHNHPRLIRYLMLFCITAFFIWGDSFLPVGTYHP